MKLYAVVNSGDASSISLTRLTEEELNVIIKVFSNMVRPYFCPSVAIYHINEEDLREINIHSLSDDPFDENYIENKDILKLDGKYYTWADKYYCIYCDAEKVFDEE